MYSARPRRMAKQQAIRANGATRGAAHVTAGSREKGTCPSVRRERSEKGEEAVAGGADGAKYTNGEDCDAEVSRGGESANETVVHKPTASPRARKPDRGPPYTVNS